MWIFTFFVDKLFNNLEKQQKKQVTADKLIQPVREENSTEITAERIEDILRKAGKRFNNQQLKKLEKDREVWNWENGKQYIRDLCRNEREFTICQQSVEFKQADEIWHDYKNADGVEKYSQ